MPLQVDEAGRAEQTRLREELSRSEARVAALTQQRVEFDSELRRVISSGYMKEQLALKHSRIHFLEKARS